MKVYCACGAEKKVKGWEPPREELRCEDCLRLMSTFRPRTKGIDRKSKKASEPSRPAVEEVEILLAQAEWAREVRKLPCAVCGKRCGVTRGHHVLYQQWLESVAKTLGIDFDLLLRWDKRNRLPVGDRCHDRHHDAVERIPRAVLVKHCPEVFAMAAELGHGLERRLTDTYPDALAKAAA
ncbi:MAG TPA: hypothetical protein VEW67_04140 [Thermoleophilaceae bacterium]|nr:hypothetical protein [Thermoleophilaceae bacterium]